MKKRIIALLLSALLLANVTACNSAPETNDESTLEDTFPEETTKPEEDPETRPRLKIGTYAQGFSSYENLPDLYQSVLADRTPLFHVREEQELYFGECKFPYFQTKVSDTSFLYFTVLDLDGDGKEEVIVTDSGDMIVLRAHQGTVYAYGFTFRSMYHLQTNGVYHWTSNAGLTYGSAKLRFDGNQLVIDELERVEKDAEQSEKFQCYVNGALVSYEDFCSHREQVYADQATWYPVIRTHEELLSGITESVSTADIPSDAELVEEGTYSRIWRSRGDFYFYYCVYDATEKPVLCERTQRPVKIEEQNDSIVDISVSAGTGNSNSVHRYYDPLSDRFSAAYTNVEVRFGSLLVYLSRTGIKHFGLRVEHLFEPNTQYDKTYRLDFAPIDVALESPVKSLSLAEDEKSILISYLAGEDRLLTYSRIPLVEDTHIPTEPIPADFASYESILSMYEKMVETIPLFRYADWGKGDPWPYDAMFAIPNETAEEWYREVLTSVFSYALSEDPFYAYGYTICDLNGDGIDELILRYYNHRVLAVFSTVDGKPVLLDSYQPRGSCWIDPDGLLRVNLSGGWAYFRHQVYQVAPGGAELILLEEHGSEGEAADTSDPNEPNDLLRYIVINGEHVRVTQEEYDTHVASIPYHAFDNAYYRPAYLNFVSLFDETNPAPAPYIPFGLEPEG